MRRNCPEVPFDDIASDLLNRRFRPVTTDCKLARKVRQSDTLQMLRVEKHVPGDFCWIELATTDQTSAKKFYSELFGWDIHHGAERLRCLQAARLRCGSRAAACRRAEVERGSGSL